MQHYRKTRLQHGNHHVGDVGGYCFLQHYRKTRLSQPPGLPNWETFTMLEMLEVIVFYNTIAKLACNMQEAIVFCNTITTLACNMEIQMLEVWGAMVCLQHHRNTLLSQAPGLPNWETFVMKEMLEAIVFWQHYRKIRLQHVGACCGNAPRMNTTLGGPSRHLSNDPKTTRLRVASCRRLCVLSPAQPWSSCVRPLPRCNHPNNIEFGGGRGGEGICGRAGAAWAVHQSGLGVITNVNKSNKVSRRRVS